MAYSDDAVKAKLNSLNETQDSIVANAQWIMFHRRHADRTASQWLARLQEVPVVKRLVLIYLANEVVQQSRARGKQDFLLAFEPVIADATSLAYKGASSDVQGKLRRVVEVWRQRSIFDKRILDTVEQRLDELDKQRGSKIGGGGKLGGSLFGSSGGGQASAEIEAINKHASSTRMADVTSTSAVTNAQTEYTKLSDPNAEIPTPPVHAAKLSGLMKTLATAQSAVEASIKARQELLAALEKLVEDHRNKLAADNTALNDLVTKKDGIEEKKRDVEDSIMRAMSAPPSPDADNGATVVTNGSANDSKLEKPEIEGFTPPPPDIETFTPPAANDGGATLPGDPAPLLGSDDPDEHRLSNSTGAERLVEQPVNLNEPPPSFEPPPAAPSRDSSSSSALAANRFLDNFHLPVTANAHHEAALAPRPTTSDPRAKRRKTTHEPADVDEDIFGGANVDTGVDEEAVTALLSQ